jgi:hypothetical protein
MSYGEHRTHAGRQASPDVEQRGVLLIFVIAAMVLGWLLVGRSTPIQSYPQVEPTTRVLPPGGNGPILHLRDQVQSVGPRCW